MRRLVLVAGDFAESSKAIAMDRDEDGAITERHDAATTDKCVFGLSHSVGVFPFNGAEDGLLQPGETLFSHLLGWRRIGFQTP